MEQVNLIIKGRVQGVFFRHNTKKTADSLGILGWVRNNPDGTVEIVAEGTEEKLEKFISWCRKGPAYSRVDSLEVIKKNKIREASYTGFEINY